MEMDSMTALESNMRQRATTDWQTNFWPAFLLAFVTCGIYWIYVLYKLLDRRQQHFERLVYFRYNLVQVLKQKAEAAGRLTELEADFSQLENLHVTASNQDREGEKSPALWLVLSLAVPFIAYYVYYFLNNDFRAHEANEYMFNMRASELMQKLGMTQQPLATTMMVPERNFVTFLILTFVTCGIYGIYWLYTLITDPNNHFDNHAVWENQLYSILTAQGAGGGMAQQ